MGNKLNLGIYRQSFPDALYHDFVSTVSHNGHVETYCLAFTAGQGDILSRARGDRYPLPGLGGLTFEHRGVGPRRCPSVRHHKTDRGKVAESYRVRFYLQAADDERCSCHRFFWDQFCR